MGHRQCLMEFSVRFLEYLTSVHLKSAMFENSSSNGILVVPVGAEEIICECALLTWAWQNLSPKKLRGKAKSSSAECEGLQCAKGWQCAKVGSVQKAGSVQEVATAVSSSCRPEA